MFRSLVVLLFAGALWMSLGAPPARAQEDDSSPANHPLVGSWFVRVEVDGNPPLELPNLVSFTADGVVLVAAPTLLPEVPGAGTENLFSSGHGAWMAAGPAAADVRFAFLVVDEQGRLASLNVIDGRLHVGDDGESYTGEYTLVIHPAAGATQSPVSGTWAATRIAVGTELTISTLAPKSTPAA
jgi:hypothetical protein